MKKLMLCAVASMFVAGASCVCVQSARADSHIETAIHAVGEGAKHAFDEAKKAIRGAEERMHKAVESAKSKFAEIVGRYERSKMYHKHHHAGGTGGLLISPKDHDA